MSNEPGAVLITGCSSGIGHETARHLQAGGWAVYATARRPETLADLAEAGCKTLALDVTDETSMRSAVDEVEAAEGRVGALVNNAGYSQSGAVETLPMAKIRAQFETNVFGLVRMSQLVLPGMRRAGKGRIVNVSSMGGKLVFPGGGAYHATKFAVEAFSDALRWEVRDFGIQVSVIEPGLITTRFGETAAGSITDTEAAEVDDADDPYARFNAAVGAATQGIYEDGPLARLGGGPETVARAIERAISARRPRTRYKVTASARLALAQRKLVTDRAWDAMMRTQFPSPGRG
jgi:NAD(P)-dependent dehydrogenase (short-subunit alcohol dehydrogenase family)